MAVKRGLNKAKGLGSLIPQTSSARKVNNRPPEESLNYEEPDADAGEEEEENRYKDDRSSQKETRSKTRKATKKKNENVSRETTDENTLKFLRISEVFPNKSQPRKQFDEESLAELADSIKAHGILQPLIVQKNGSDYEIVSGERRWRAAKLAGLKKIPVVIREYSDEESMEVSLIENIQRENLNAIEEALAYDQLMKEYHYTQEEIAKKVSKSRSAIANTMRLLNLPEEIQGMLVENTISMGHARALLSLDNADIQLEAAEAIKKENLTVRQTEDFVKKLQKDEKKQKSGKENPHDPADTQLEAVLKDLENKMTERIGTKVRIQNGRNSKGKIEIEYYSREDLDRIINRIL